MKEQTRNGMVTNGEFLRISSQYGRPFNKIISKYVFISSTVVRIIRLLFLTENLFMHNSIPHFSV